MSIEKDIPLLLLQSRLAVCRLSPDADFPDWARPGELLALIRTPDELSVICDDKYVPPNVKAERGWRVFQVQGPLDFSMTGVLSSITTSLAEAGVSVFAVSTYDTDYILVKDRDVERALTALEKTGFLVLSHVRLSS